MGDIRLTDSGGTVVGGITVKTPYEDKDSKGVKVEDFLQLMIAQMSNQDFMNPTDDTQYVTQMAQFAQMESMQELSHYSQTNYAQSLVGKTVTAATYGIGGNVTKETGVVEKMTISSDEGFLFTVNGKQFKLSQLMEIKAGSGTTSAEDIDGSSKMPLIVQSSNSNSISFRWQAPTTDEAKQKDLNYSVYYVDATDENVKFDSVDDVVKNGTLSQKGLTELNAAVSGLDPNKTYFINVVVTNKAGDQSVYQHATLKT